MNDNFKTTKSGIRKDAAFLLNPLLIILQYFENSVDSP